MADLDPATVPGFREAVAALTAWMVDPNDFGVQPHHVGEMAAVVMFASRPHVQAELFADLSDKLDADGFAEVAWILDYTSHCLREALNGR